MNRNDDDEEEEAGGNNNSSVDVNTGYHESSSERPVNLSLGITSKRTSDAESKPKAKRLRDDDFGTKEEVSAEYIAVLGSSNYGDTRHSNAYATVTRPRQPDALSDGRGANVHPHFSARSLAGLNNMQFDRNLLPIVHGALPTRDINLAANLLFHGQMAERYEQLLLAEAATAARPSLNSLLLASRDVGTLGARFPHIPGTYQDIATIRSLVQLERLQQAALATLSNTRHQQESPGLGNSIHDRSALVGQASTGVPVLEASSNAIVEAIPPQEENCELGETIPETSLQLPFCEEGDVEPFSARPYFSLGIDEDPNWLSEFHCYVRSQLLEVFRANHEDVKSRNNSIFYQQVGFRCRFCAHLSPNARGGRSSAFPSSLQRIYQSFTMMLRDHFTTCEAIPKHVLNHLVMLKGKPSQGATDSKRYWIYSAMKIGMTDTEGGIAMTDQSRALGAASSPFGSIPERPLNDDMFRSVALVTPSDRPNISAFLFSIITEVQPIRLADSECIGNRRSLPVGLPGFGCRHCCEARRLGLCRMFPARRRTLPSKVNDIYDHLRRCNALPKPIKLKLEALSNQANSKGFLTDQGLDREFFDRMWIRMGHVSQIT
jgi:hypothetical protein